VPYATPLSSAWSSTPALPLKEIYFDKGHGRLLW